ncbi:F-box/kelch-repeat protein SKIP25 [Prunus yedoensis var. nudiflora]|uniref:F-box/kelch-repeat protein SKIP25 n=1 Tax=Prunus yedoensis var. nudiflora TaxID=2094558 RepID=A0A314XFA5_PRUYE|nr:F-box/kelch-repeat protein SKIP25 [Prunus yedoensis var. nudiflora]
MAAPYLLSFLPSFFLSLRHSLSTTTSSPPPQPQFPHSVLLTRPHIKHMDISPSSSVLPSSPTPPLPPILPLPKTTDPMVVRLRTPCPRCCHYPPVHTSDASSSCVPTTVQPVVLRPPLPEPRRWCGVGTVGGKVYVASGIGTTYRGDVARSMEEWDTKRNEASSSWVKKACLKDGKFSREDVEAIGYRGKLWMVNSKGNAVKEGVVYDVQKDTWQDMPQGMLGGWNGPAAATINDDGHDDDVMYVVDERKGVLNKYVDENDCWEMVMESFVLREAEQVCAGRGRVCVVCANGRKIVVVDVVATPPRIWVVEPPPMLEVVAVHILPRMCRPD